MSLKKDNYYGSERTVFLHQATKKIVEGRNGRIIGD
jgi:hypothetical protein